MDIAEQIDQYRSDIAAARQQQGQWQLRSEQWETVQDEINRLTARCRSAMQTNGLPVCSDDACCANPEEFCHKRKHAVCAEHVNGCTACVRDLKGRKVLVVDDERVIADTLWIILSSYGLQTKCTYTGESAMATIRAWAPDFVLTDVVMPGLNGIELAIRVTQLDPHCRILLFSGHAATADLAIAARKRGYNFSVLSKPVHPRDLFEVIISYPSCQHGA